MQPSFNLRALPYLRCHLRGNNAAKLNRMIPFSFYDYDAGKFRPDCPALAVSVSSRLERGIETVTTVPGLAGEISKRPPSSLMRSCMPANPTPTPVPAS